jgi:hypothetical protein
MGDAFFDLKSARDMLEKAKRERAKLTADLNIDNIFNFFVTAYHVRDYLMQAHGIPKLIVDAFVKNHPDLDMCHFICNKGKHLTLDPWKNEPDRNKSASVSRVSGSAFNASAFNTTAFNAGPIQIFRVDGKEIDILNLPDRVLQGWEVFFVQHTIP